MIDSAGVAGMSEQEMGNLNYKNLNDIIEPSSAAPLAALLENKQIFKDKKVGVIISGGNFSSS